MVRPLIKVDVALAAPVVDITLKFLNRSILESDSYLEILKFTIINTKREKKPEERLS